MARGEESAAALIDLAKAFEYVRLELVWEAGKRLKFPEGILRLMLETFAFVRHLLLNGAMSEAVATLSAILAGSSFAIDALFMVLVEPCDHLARCHQVDLCLFVDDLTIDAVGTAQFVQHTLPGALRDCIGFFEQKLKFVVSRGKTWQIDPKAKTVAIASSRELERTLAISMRALGVPMHKQVKLLGIDYGSGKRLKRCVQKGRLAVIVHRKHRYERLGPTAARRLVNTGALPALRYGAGVIGANKTMIKAARRFACSVRGDMRGRSSFARLNLAN